MYSCSYCDRPADWVGDGQDGDFYCEAHKHLRLDTVSPIEEDR